MPFRYDRWHTKMYTRFPYILLASVRSNLPLKCLILERYCLLERLQLLLSEEDKCLCKEPSAPNCFASMANRWNCDDFIEIAGKLNLNLMLFVCFVYVRISKLYTKVVKVLQIDFLFGFFFFFVEAVCSYNYHRVMLYTHS